MRRLILTSSSGLGLKQAGRAELVVPFMFRFVWGPLPPSEVLAAYLGPRTDEHEPGNHWSDFVHGWPEEDRDGKYLALADFCETYDVVELWFDPAPNDQLQLVWLLDFLSSRPALAARLKLRIVDFDLNTADRRGLANWKVFDLAVTADELGIARDVWQAYRSTNPRNCFDLFSRDLSALPLLRPALSDLLEELPSSLTGLGGTEMRLLELIARGFSGVNGLFYLHGLSRRRVFQALEIGSLLDGLAHVPNPAITGLGDELSKLDAENPWSRFEAYQRSRVSLTEFGKSIVAHADDFSRDNPVDRWWGGTRLTNANLWRWDQALLAP